MSERLSWLVGTAAVAVILGGLRWAGELLAPVLLGVMVAALTSPLVVASLRRGVPPLVGALLVLGLDVSVLGLFGGLLALAVSDLQERLPLYLQKLSIVGDRFGGAAEELLARFAGVASHTGVVLLVVFFTSWELGLLARKLKALSDNAPAQYARVNSIVQQVQRYLVVKTWTSLLIAVAAYAVLRGLGVGSALLLAIGLFVLHFIPNVGAFLAAAPALLVAWAERGAGVAAMVAAAYLVLNTVIGGILEPKMLGNRLGISPLVVLLGMLFWGWMWGPVGAILAVPLLVVGRIVLENSPDLAWLAVWLEAEPDLPDLSKRLSLPRIASSLRRRSRPATLPSPAPPSGAVAPPASVPSVPSVSPVPSEPAT